MLLVYIPIVSIVWCEAEAQGFLSDLGEDKATYDWAVTTYVSTGRAHTGQVLELCGQTYGKMRRFLDASGQVWYLATEVMV
jgi:hypothetical protein